MARKNVLQNTKSQPSGLTPHPKTAAEEQQQLEHQLDREQDQHLSCQHPWAHYPDWKDQVASTLSAISSGLPR